MKTTLFFLFLLLSTVIITACVSQAPEVTTPSAVPAMTTVNVGYLPLISYAPLFIAQEEGYFTRQGIHVEFQKLQSTAMALPILASGDIDTFGGSASPGLFNAIAKGSHIHIVADKGRIVPGSCNSSAFMVRRDLYEDGTIRTISDMKGLKIMAGSSEQYTAVRSLAVGNLTLADVDIVNMDYPTGVVALKNGAVDGGVLTEPYISEALNSGSAVVLLRGEQYLPDYPFPLYYGPTFLDKDPALGRRFMIAYLQGAEQYNKGKTERNLEILQNYTHLDPVLLKQSCWLPIAKNGTLPYKPVMEYMNWLYTRGSIHEQLREDQVFDMSYVTYANGVLDNRTGSG
jgi:NitT/TauT family transport system substrate-binding protein